VQLGKQIGEDIFKTRAKSWNKKANIVFC